MPLTIVEFIGRFHPLLVHLPIGILLLALLLQWLSRKEQYTLSHGVMKLIWSIGILSALLSSITGYMLSLSGEYEENTVALHMWMGIGVVAVSLLIGAKVFSRQFDAVYKASCIALLVLITGTGHFGGSLTHGGDYLSAALSSGEEALTANAIKPIANVQEAHIYADVVQPILQARCYSCHGKQKQKGKLRMDSPEFLLKGGKNGEIIVPGNAEASEMIKRLLLPKEDEHHMPPKEKPQLTEKQITLLHWWIEKGASFDKRVKDLEQNDEVKPILASLQQAEQPVVKKSDIWPDAAIKPADPKAVKALTDKGVVVLPIAQNSHYLTVNFVTANDVADEDLKGLLPLKDQLVWLKLNDTRIGDGALPFISQCRNIRILQLNHTAITDQELAALNNLPELRSLHLVGTRITAKGLLRLDKLKKLQSLYLFQTNIDKKDWQKLITAFPNAVLDTGGYKVPTLPSDTTEVKAAVK